MPAMSGLLDGVAYLASDEVDATGELEPLFEAEEAFVQGAIAKRRWDFRAGRHCARRALRRLGIEAGPLLKLPSGAPLWPQAVAGSIAHTGRGATAWAGAVVAWRERVRAVGVDAELTRELRPELWPKVLTNGERERLASVAPEARGLYALASFSAKEALYKAQASVSNRYLGFHDVQIDWQDSPDGGCGRFVARLATDVGSAFAAGDEFAGRFSITGELVLTLVTIAS